jgi:pimeloyl-ACP methyl ester carboxylesterase
VRTSDGLELAMTRVRAADRTSRGAVILQHGLASNGTVFDFPGRSLAEHLAHEGYDCFIPQLRGADGLPGAADYGLDQYLEEDVPAVIETARRESGHPRVSWVGHSMGGILMMLSAIENPGLPVERLIAIGSALDYRPGHSIYRDLRPLRRLAGHWLRRFPFDSFARANALCAGRGPSLLPEKMNFWRSNIEARTMRALLWRGFTTIPMRLLDDLSSVFASDGIARKAGQLAYVPLAGGFRLPSCLIVGSRDAQCPEVAVDETARLLRSAPQLEVARFGKAHGQVDDYGHFDSIIGKRAQTEVWPTIRRFLLS